MRNNIKHIQVWIASQMICSMYLTTEAMRMLRGWNTSAKELGWELGVFSLEKGKLWRDFTVVFWCLKGPQESYGWTICRGRTRKNCLKLKEGRFKLMVRNTFFTMRW